MPKTKYEFTRSNNIRKQEGLQPLTWIEYLRDHPMKKLGRPPIDPALRKKPTRNSFLNFYPDEPKPIMNRPSATYNNTSYTSIFEKYGV